MKREFGLYLSTAGALCLWLAASAAAFGEVKGRAASEPWRVIPSDRVVIEVNSDAAVREQLPSTLLGFNINYKSFQEQLWDARSQSLKPGIVPYLRHFGGALYRYPGGLVANGFDWSEAVGPVDEREPQKPVIGGERSSKVLFGVKEYIDFVQQVNGRNWYVLNLVGLDPMQPMREADKDAVAEHNRALAKYLVEHLGSSGFPHYYQLGNELDRAEYEWSHQKYVERARASIEAIREVDKNARFVAFLRDFKWAYRREPTRGVSEPKALLQDVTRGLPMVKDYSLHHYYDGKRGDGKSRDIPFWLRRLSESVAAYKATHDGKAPRIWITEHARQKSSDKPGQDETREYTSNLGGAISAADYLIAIAQVPEVQGACWHGLNAGPWQIFDATIRYRDLRPRPVYWGFRVLRAMDLPVVLQTRTYSPNRSSYKGGYDVRAVGFRDDERQALGLWVVNRAAQPVEAEIAFPAFKGQEVSILHYYLAGKPSTDPDQLSSEPSRELEPKPQKGQFSANGRLTLSLPPASVSTFIIRKSAPAAKNGARGHADA